MFPMVKEKKGNWNEKNILKGEEKMNRWFKYTLVTSICEEMKKRGYKLGKTGVQKLVFILKSLYDIPVDYSYELYIYGPYSSELTGDLDFLDSADVVDVSFEDYGDYRGYNILPAEESKKVFDRGEKYVEEFGDMIKQVVDRFGGKNARDLELVGTLIYLRFEEGIKNDELLEERIKEIKPHFSEKEIQKGVDEVKRIV